MHELLPPEYPKIETVWDRSLEHRVEKNVGAVLPGAWRLAEFEMLKDCKWQWFEKLDGENVRVGWDGTTVMWAGRHGKSILRPTLGTYLQEHITPTRLSAAFPDANPEAPIWIYAEGMGKGIQKPGNAYARFFDGGVGIVILDVRIGKWWLRQEDVGLIAARMGLTSPPIVGKGTVDDAALVVQHGFDSQLGAVRAEGIVARLPWELQTRGGARVMWKLKTRDFPRGA